MIRPVRGYSLEMDQEVSETARAFYDSQIEENC